MPDSPRRPPEQPFPRIPLLTLAAATFLSITVEMLPTGLLPLMTAGLGVTQAQVGLLMTVYAFTVIVLSTPLVYLLQRVPKRELLVAVLTLFAVGTIGTALAPTYPLVVVSRVFTGVAHGLFWATVTSYTASLVTTRQLTKAVSITGGGGGLAFVLGVPLSTALGQLFGWRTTFVVIAVLSLAIAGMLWLLLPARPPAPRTDTVELAVPHPASEVGARPRRSMRLVAAVTLLCAVSMTGHYSFYSYISPFLLDVVGLPEPWLAPALFVFGITSAVATLATGLLFSNRSTAGLLCAYAAMLTGGALVGVAFLGPAMLGLMVWGVGMGFLPTLLQSRLLSVAPQRHRDVASALYTAGFNLGIGSGAFLGGALLHFGEWAVVPCFLALEAVALVWVLVMDRGRSVLIQKKSR